MKESSHSFLTITFSIIFLNACTVHPPMSEYFMFKDEGLADTLDVSFAVAGTATFVDREYIQSAEFKTCNGFSFCEVKSIVGDGLGGLGIHAQDHGYSIAFGFPYLGIDVTRPLPGPLFITVAGSAFAGGQMNVMARGILQDRIGAAIGPSVRFQNFPVHIRASDDSGNMGGSGFFGENNVLRSEGIRALVVLKAPNAERSDYIALRAAIFAGYFSGSREPSISFGLSIGVQ